MEHCGAKPFTESGRYRMLYADVAPGRRRLFRTGDTYNPAREGSQGNELGRHSAEYADLLIGIANGIGDSMERQNQERTPYSLCVAPASTLGG